MVSFETTTLILQVQGLAELFRTLGFLIISLARRRLWHFRAGFCNSAQLVVCACAAEQLQQMFTEAVMYSVSSQGIVEAFVTGEIVLTQQRRLLGTLVKVARCFRCFRRKSSLISLLTSLYRLSQK